MRFVAKGVMGLVSSLLVGGCCEVGEHLSVFTLGGSGPGWQCVPGSPTGPGPGPDVDAGPPLGGFIDIGVLPGDERSGAVRINNRGTVVGFSYSGPTSRAYRWTRETGMIELPGFGGEASVRDLNDFDEAVGSAYVPQENVTRAVMWDADGNVRELGTLEGQRAFSWAIAINNKGEVLGEVSSSEGGGTFFLWTREEGMRRLDMGIDRDRIGVHPRDMNDHRVVVGTTYEEGRFSPQRAFEWSPEGGFRYLAPEDGEAVRVNNHGESAGCIYFDPTHVQYQGVIFGRGIVHAFDGPFFAYPQSLNDEGVVVGGLPSPETRSPVAARWRSLDRPEPLPLEAEISHANDINNRGQIVGSFQQAGAQHRSYVWTPPEGD
jgi:uncharacterized membrane protein